jgi:hypothetical protein
MQNFNNNSNLYNPNVTIKNFCLNGQYQLGAGTIQAVKVRSLRPYKNGMTLFRRAFVRYGCGSYVFLTIATISHIMKKDGFCAYLSECIYINTTSHTYS